MDKVKFIDCIRQIDVEGKIVSFDLEKSKIEYSKKITKGRNIFNLTDEELVRAYFVVKFIIQMGYGIDDIILEKEYTVGGRTITRPRIDIIVKEKGEKPKTYLFMETKAPDKFDADKDLIKNELFELGKLEDKTSPIAYLCYCTADIDEERIREKNIIIDYSVYFDYNKWIADGKLALDIFQKDYGVPRKIKYIKNKTDLRINVGKAEFDSIRKDLHNVLWGGGETSYNDVFVGLVKIFLAKIYDESTTISNKPYIFQIEYVDKVPETPEDIYRKVNDLYKAGLRTYLHYSKEQIEEEALNKRAISPAKMRYVVEQMQGISLTKNKNTESDLLGDFFEKIVTEGFKQDKGQFFTHSNIVKFIIYALGIDDCAIEKVNNDTVSGLPYICDPSCGSGTFLIDVMKIVTDTLLNRRKDEIDESDLVKSFLEYKLPTSRPNTWAFDFLYGVEINADLALATKVNMVLHGDGSGNIYCKNALSPFTSFTNNERINLLSYGNSDKNDIYKKPQNGQFDFIITNPPFSIKMDNETKAKLPQSFEYYDRGNIENLFIERYYQLLKDGGKAGIVLPENVFDTGENQYLRQFIYKYFKILALVSLGGGKDVAFLPYTGTKTSLLFLKKKSEKEIREYDTFWNENVKLYTQMQKKVEKIRITRVDSQKNRKILNDYLNGYPEFKFNENRTVEEILLNYHEEIDEINAAMDWWIFNKVSKKFDYKFLIAHTTEVGYHRTKNREFKRKNKLFSVDVNNNVIVNDKLPETILDFIKTGIEINKPDIFRLDFYDISKSFTLRCDYNFHTYKKFEEPKILNNFKNYTYLGKYITKIRNGKDISRKFYSEDASGNVIETRYKYLTTSNYTPNMIDSDGMNNITNIKGEEISKYLLNQGDILISRSGTVGVCKKFDINDENVYIPAGYIIVVEIDKDKLLPDFLAYYLNSIIMRRYFSVFGVGKTQKNIAQGDIKRIVLPVLSIEEQQKIVQELNQNRLQTEKDIQIKQTEINALINKWNKLVVDSVSDKGAGFEFLFE